jgi:trk system potassium uptake protein TrkA
MRIVFVGASQLTVMTAKLLLDRKHEVIIIETDKDLIETLAEELDCGFIHGDGSKPHILREAGPERTDVLFCLTLHDQVNILAALIGRSLGIKRVVPSIQDPELDTICQELGLESTIVPDQTIGRYLADMATGVDAIELLSFIKGDARFFAFVADKESPASVKELELPSDARVVCLYRADEFILADDDTRLRAGDEVVILTHSDNLARLRELWRPKENGPAAPRL